MNILAALAKGLWQTIKALFRRLRGLLLVFMLVLNVGMIAVPMVYDVASRVFWGAVSIASASYALRHETRAARRASLDQIEADLDRTQRRVTELDAERHRAQRRVAELDAERGRLRRETQSLNERIRTVKDELAKSRAANQRVSAVKSQVAGKVKRMQQRSIEALGRNTGAAYAEAIPVLGTVFFIGGIALDVWDTCQTMKDMHEIGRIIEFNSNDENEIETQWCGGELQKIWAELGGGPTAPKRACIEARLRTVETAPPECEGFEPRSLDPLRPPDTQREQAPLPSTDPMLE